MSGDSEKPPEPTGKGRSGALIKGNPLLKSLRSVPWEFGDIEPDYVLGQTTCALYLSLRYHQLFPGYIHSRLRSLGRAFELRLLLVQVDVADPHPSLRELSQVSLLADCTMLLAWSAEEAGRHLETYKALEAKPADALMERQEGDTLSKCLYMYVPVVNMYVAADGRNLLGTVPESTRRSGPAEFFWAGSAQDSCDVDVDGAEELMPVALRDTLRGVRFADYVEDDTGASVCGALTDEDIIAQVAGAQPVAEVPEGEEDEDDEAPVRPSASAVMEALNVARLFFSFEEGE
ncbi:hypothetical protein HPB52_021815 [Rhipicephalus sanguineus]|uniref:ERCC1-like central domain-containing protein n=1 Tax=Rhipicephalus sanguineus TaxID=34632 RepID=A0A9D4PM96_RHISA|nr:hypothetical protein HPB52_021815 [Rhipicephalus sanguineus]